MGSCPRAGIGAYRSSTSREPIRWPPGISGESVRLVLPPPVDRGMESVVLDGEAIDGRRVDAGVPHFVVFVPDVSAAPLARWAPPIRRDPRFGAAGTNVDVAQRLADGSLATRTWERGVEGETLACGSGAVAAAFAARLDGQAGPVCVVPASGIALQVDFGENAEEVRLTGDARVVFEARVGAEATWGF